ncbi:protein DETOXIFICATION 41-like isoform X2 [Prosopis cineraria]|uniref:protein DETOXIFICATION 41-like isoform X2 n=1 Tax=Prosopis cineraria TaxID=364024 RepID=UPI00240FA88E|nr:protein DETOXIFICATION 41-like isoform X2 [Prosopis cineraria]
MVSMKWWGRVVAWEGRLIWLLLWPAVIAGVFNYMLTFITLIFVGHLGDSQFAGASLACLGLQASLEDRRAMVLQSMAKFLGVNQSLNSMHMQFTSLCWGFSWHRT